MALSWYNEQLIGCDFLLKLVDINDTWSEKNNCQYRGSKTETAMNLLYLIALFVRLWRLISFMHNALYV
jgi:hypothetical protein